MKKLWRRVLAVALLPTAVAGGLLVAGRADAQQVTTGTLSFSGDSGDYISGGKSYSYDTSKGDALDVSSANGSTFSLRITGYNGDWWTLDLDAPGSPDRPVPGQSAVLVPGTYSAAHRYPFNGTGPGLDLSGNGRGCNELTGSFTITKAVFSGSYVQSFDATFEQHCENGTTAARGQVHIANAPAPPGTATTTRPAPTTGRTTATGKPTATRSGNATATTSPPAAPTTTGPSGVAVAGSGDTGAGDVDAHPVATPAMEREAFRTPLVLIGVGVVAWIVIAAVGLAGVGIVLAIRRR